MPRKRKVPAFVPINEESDENDENAEPSRESNNASKQHGPMYHIMSNVQLNETFHNKYIKEMQQLYLKMDHDAFMFTFIKMIKSAMAAEETNEYASTTLIFCAKFVSSYDGEDTHPILSSTFKWLLSTISNNPHIRFRLCQFVNMVLNALGIEAALDDTICDNILSYMVNRLRDLNPNVRVQAILALQRLQIPDNPDDIVVKTYQFHLSSDPSSRVRQAVITSMGRNYNTIPYILERLWDVDEKVRRHTYLHMSSYPVKAYKVAQRLTFLEQGLNDRSDMVRKVVTTVMLPQWLESYNRNIISLISALKLDANEGEIDRFRKITKMALFEIFKRQKKEDLVKALPLEDEESEYYKCVPYEKLTVEVALYWLCLNEYLQMENADELDSIIPELTTFCNYVQKYCESSRSDMDKWQKMEYQYVLLTLMEIVNTFDLGDEIGRDNLKILLETLLKNFDIEEHTIKVIIQCTEKLITKLEDRLQFFVDIIKDISDAKSLTNELSHDRTLIEELLEKHPDKKDLKFQISALKVKMLELEEQETDFVRKKDYAQAQRIAEELTACREEYMNILKPVLNQVSTSDSADARKFMSLTFQQKKMSPEVLIKSLQISYYMVASKNVKSLTPNVCDLYKDFIRRHVESNQIAVRDWAFRCGTAYSMLYETLAKDVYNELHSQFYKNHNVRLWKTAIECIFELLDRYGFSHFEVEDKNNKSRKTGRQLYNSNTMESIDAEEDTSSSGAYGVDLIFMMSHFLDTCDDVCIISAIVVGFSRLVLHGHIKNDDIIEKLILKYFNPLTDPGINQILGVFFENLIKKRKQEFLQQCLLPTISSIMGAPYDSPLHEIKPENVLRFVIDSTRPLYCKPNLNIHNTIAMSFMQEMLNNISNKELLKLLSKELITLEVLTTDDSALRDEMRSCVEKLLQCDIDPKTAKYLGNFREILDGVFNPNTVSIRATTGRKGGSDEELEEGSDEEDENRNIIEENTNKEKQKDKTALDAVLEEPDTENSKANETCEENQTNDSQNLEKETNDTAEDNEPETQDTIQSPEKSKEKENETPTIPPELQTPTTFGKDNTTNLRYLRKSMNTHKRSLEELSPKKPKLRTDEKQTARNTRARRNIQMSPTKQNQRPIARGRRSKGHESSQVDNDKNQPIRADPEIDKTQASIVADKEKTTTPSNQSSLVGNDTQPTETEVTEESTLQTSNKTPPIQKEKEANVRLPSAESRQSQELSAEVDTNASSKELVEEDKIDSTEEASLTVNETKEDTSACNDISMQETEERVERRDSSDEIEPLVVSEDEVASSSSDEEHSEVAPSPNAVELPTVRSRRNAGSKKSEDKNDPKSTRRSENNSTKNEKSKSKSTTTDDQNKRDGGVKRRQLLFTSPDAGKENAYTSPAREQIKRPVGRPKKIQVEKPESTKVQSTTDSAHKTRSATKQEMLRNTIITRKRMSLENMATGRRTSTPASKKNSNQENSVSSSKKNDTSPKKTSAKEVALKRLSNEKNQTTSKAVGQTTKPVAKPIEVEEKQTKSRTEKSNTESREVATPVNRISTRVQSQSVPKARPTRAVHVNVSSSVKKPSVMSTRLRTKK